MLRNLGGTTEASSHVLGAEAFFIAILRIKGIKK